MSLLQAQTLRRGLRAAVRGSTVVELFQLVSTWFSEDEESRSEGETVLSRLLEDSLVYRWILREPVSERIEIDLAGTYLLTPVISITIAVVGVADRCLTNSALVRVLTPIANGFREGLATRFGRVVDWVSAPPIQDTETDDH